MGGDPCARNCHKWMLAPKGSGFLYARSEVQSLLDPLVVSWGWGGECTPAERFVSDHQQSGTRDHAAFLSVPAAIRYMNEHNWPAVQARCHETVRLAREQIAALTGLDPIMPDQPQWFRQMAAVPLPGCEGGELGRRLREDYSIVVPVFEYQDRCLMRISIQAYNDEQDVASLTGALRELLPLA